MWKSEKITFDERKRKSTSAIANDENLHPNVDDEPTQDLSTFVRAAALPVRKNIALAQPRRLQTVLENKPVYSKSSDGSITSPQTKVLQDPFRTEEKVGKRKKSSQSHDISELTKVPITLYVTESNHIENLKNKQNDATKCSSFESGSKLNAGDGGSAPVGSNDRQGDVTKLSNNNLMVNDMISVGSAHATSYEHEARQRTKKSSQTKKGKVKEIKTNDIEALKISAPGSETMPKSFIKPMEEKNKTMMESLNIPYKQLSKQVLEGNSLNQATNTGAMFRLSNIYTSIDNGDMPSVLETTSENNVYKELFKNDVFKRTEKKNSDKQSRICLSPPSQSDDAEKGAMILMTETVAMSRKDDEQTNKDRELKINMDSVNASGKQTPDPNPVLLSAMEAVLKVVAEIAEVGQGNVNIEDKTSDEDIVVDQRSSQCAMEVGINNADVTPVVPKKKASNQNMPDFHIEVITDTSRKKIDNKEEEESHLHSSSRHVPFHNTNRKIDPNNDKPRTNLHEKGKMSGKGSDQGANTTSSTHNSPPLKEMVVAEEQERRERRPDPSGSQSLASPLQVGITAEASMGEVNRQSPVGKKALNTPLRKTTVDEVEEREKSLSGPAVPKILDTPLKHDIVAEAAMRDRKRPSPIGDKVIDTPLKNAVVSEAEARIRDLRSPASTKALATPLKKTIIAEAATRETNRPGPYNNIKALSTPLRKVIITEAEEMKKRRPDPSGSHSLASSLQLSIIAEASRREANCPSPVGKKTLNTPLRKKIVDEAEARKMSRPDSAIPKILDTPLKHDILAKAAMRDAKRQIVDTPLKRAIVSEAEARKRHRPNPAGMKALATPLKKSIIAEAATRETNRPGPYNNTKALTTPLRKVIITEAEGEKKRRPDPLGSQSLASSLQLGIIAEASRREANRNTFLRKRIVDEAEARGKNRPDPAVPKILDTPLKHHIVSEGGTIVAESPGSSYWKRKDVHDLVEEEGCDSSNDFTEIGDTSVTIDEMRHQPDCAMKRSIQDECDNTFVGEVCAEPVEASVTDVRGTVIKDFSVDQTTEQCFEDVNAEGRIEGRCHVNSLCTLRVSEMRKECKKRGLLSSGSRDVLILRLQNVSSSLQMKIEPKRHHVYNKHINASDEGPIERRNITGQVSKAILVTDNTYMLSHSNDKSQDELKNEPIIESMDSQNFGTMRVLELRAECKKRGLDTKGKKADLIARLSAFNPQIDVPEVGNGENAAHYSKECKVQSSDSPGRLVCEGLVTEPLRSEVSVKITNDHSSSDDSAQRDMQPLEPSKIIPVMTAGSSRNVLEIGPEDGVGHKDNESVHLEKINWKSLKVTELQRECRIRGLPSKGLKAELIAILQDSIEQHIEVTVSRKRFAADESAQGLNESLTKRLKLMNDDANISTVEPMPDFSSMKVSELRAECIKRDLESKGKKADLFARLCNIFISTKEPFDKESEVVTETRKATNKSHSSHSYSPPSILKGVFPEEQAEESVFSSDPKQLDFHLMKVTELREECKMRGINSKGKKATLIARLKEENSQ